MGRRIRVEDIPKKYFNFYKLKVYDKDVIDTLNYNPTWRQFDRAMQIKYGEDYPPEMREEDWVRYAYTQNCKNLYDVELVQKWINGPISSISRNYNVGFIQAIQKYEDYKEDMKNKPIQIDEYTEESP